MNDYFDELEQALKDAVARRAHLRWLSRLRLPVRHRGLVIGLATLVVAAPAVAAVGAASGWFSPGKPDIYYPASVTSGLGKVLKKGDRLLPIRVPDPDGGPAWGMRLVTTSRGDTCVQVGRVEDGQIGALGIDGAWNDDHHFHEIKPNDGLADICGATDGAGNGFANQQAYGAPASVDVPLYNSGGGSPGRCRSPFLSPVAERLGGHFKDAPPALRKLIKREQSRISSSKVCPASGMRMVFAGLLGPDAKSVSYKTPSGQIKTEPTAGGVGAYLIVFRETAANCADFTTTLLSSTNSCRSDGSGAGAALRGPTAITSVTYNSGKTCSVQPDPGLAAAYKSFSARLRADKHQTAKHGRAQFARFLAAHRLTRRNWIQALLPRCPPVGWVTPKQKRVTAADVRSPLTVSVTEGRRFCSKGPWKARSVQDNTIVCDSHVPAGYKSYWESSEGSSGPVVALIRVSFVAREPVTTTNSFYEWDIQEPGNHGGSGNRTQSNVRRGERVTFTMTEAIPDLDATNAIRGVYHGTIGFISNVGQAGPEIGGNNPGHDGSVTVGKFSFRLPLKK